mgnify:CR=1 FL=1
MAISGIYRQLITAAVVVLLVAGMYATGKLLGRATEQRPASGTAAPSASSTPPGSSHPSIAPAPAPRGAPRPDTAFVPPVMVSPTASPVPPPEFGPLGALTVAGTAYAALTFDDGPDPRWTPQVLEVLRFHGVRATFCVVGENAAAHPELIRLIVAEGHTLCNHSWNHDVGLGERARAEIEADLLRTNAAIRAAVPGAEIAYYRQPGGAWTPEVVEVAEELGMTALHWTVDPQDWQQPAAREISTVVRNAVFPGAIVLLHDGGGDRQGTVRAVDLILGQAPQRVDFGALPATPPQL